MNIQYFIKFDFIVSSIFRCYASISYLFFFSARYGWLFAFVAKLFLKFQSNHFFLMVPSEMILQL